MKDWVARKLFFPKLELWACAITILPRVWDQSQVLMLTRPTSYWLGHPWGPNCGLFHKVSSPKSGAPSHGSSLPEFPPLDDAVLGFRIPAQESEEDTSIQKGQVPFPGLSVADSTGLSKHWPTQQDPAVPVQCKWIILTSCFSVVTIKCLESKDPQIPASWQTPFIFCLLTQCGLFSSRAAFVLAPLGSAALFSFGKASSIPFPHCKSLAGTCASAKWPSDHCVVWPCVALCLWGTT